MKKSAQNPFIRPLQRLGYWHHVTLSKQKQLKI